MIGPKYYYYYYSNGANDKKIEEIDVCLKFIDDALTLIGKLINSDFIEAQVRKHFSKVKKNDKEYTKELNPDYDYFESLTKSFTEVKNEVLFKIQEIRRNYIDNDFKNNLWNKMKDAGLTGVQLEIKINLVYSLFNDCMKWIVNGFKSLTSETKKLIAKTLLQTNKFLLSLISPFGFVEILKELKDTTEFYIDN